MKIIKKFFAGCLAAMMTLSCIPHVAAADAGTDTAQNHAIIDTSAVGSLTIYKYDITNGATRS